MKHIVRAAHIAALYFALTVLLAPISYGVVQFRISEALCILTVAYAGSGYRRGYRLPVRKRIRR